MTNEYVNYLGRVTAIALLVIILLFGILLLAVRAEEYSDSEICQAIWVIEGGAKAQYAYGIRSVKYRDRQEARRICYNTVRNNRKRYADYGYKQYPDFLSFLQSRYCPIKGKLSKAERKLNGNWLRNLRYQLAKARDKK